MVADGREKEGEAGVGDVGDAFGGEGGDAGVGPFGGRGGGRGPGGEMRGGGGENFSAEGAAVVRERGRARVGGEGDFGFGEETGDEGGARFQAGEIILHEDAGAVEEGDAAENFLRGGGIGGREIGDGEGAGGGAGKGDEGGGGVVFLQRVAGGERVVAVVVEAVVFPAGRGRALLGVEVAWEVVVVGAEVAGPADAVGVEDEGAEVEVGVVDVVAAGLEADEEGAGVVPPAAEEGELSGAVEAGVEGRRVFCRRFWIGGEGREPDPLPRPYRSGSG